MTNPLVRKPLFSDFEELTRLIDYANNQTSVFRRNELTHKVDYNSNPSVIEVEVPGVNPSDVKVKIEGRSLFVETPKGNLYLPIGQRLDSEAATANLKHGLLTVRIPKRDAKIVNVLVHED
jgi:HSP20 family molecular chaperone IbpA